jgi:hydroxymethylpyrimidine pyrophosphatase-like HAD family hydrolase
LSATLDSLGLSSHEVVAIGDAENDYAFLSLCECSVAVANALETLKEHVDWVTRGEDGAGVGEVIEELVAKDLEGGQVAAEAKSVSRRRTNA